MLTQLQNDRFARKEIMRIAEEVVREHGQNNSVGKFDEFYRLMADRWADSGHDRSFIKYVIEKAYQEQFA